MDIDIYRNKNGVFIGSIPSIRACYAQGKDKGELLERLLESAIACVSAMTKEEVEKI